MIYWILVTRDAGNSIVSLHSPDLQLELLDQHSASQSNFNYRSFIRDFFNSYDMSMDITPYDLQLLIKKEITILQHWEAFDIIVDEDHTCCVKLLPITGQIANLLAIVSGGFVTFMALQISSHNSNETKKYSSNILSITGALLDSIALLIIYNFSDANNVLAGVGVNFDRLICRASTRHALIGHQQGRYNNLNLFLSALAIIFVFCNTIIVSIRRYQEIDLLIDRFLELSEIFDQDQKDILNIFVADLYTVSMAYSGVAFQGSFSFKFVNSMQKKLQDRNNGLFFRHGGTPPPRVHVENELPTSEDERTRLNHSPI